MRFRLAALALIAVLGLFSLVDDARPTGAAGSVLLPFPAGTSVKVIQGYHGGTHRGVDEYSLDLALTGGDTAGTLVLAPVAGQIDWAYGPGVGNGCLAILLPDGSGLGVMLCHVIFDQQFNFDEPITLGQRLGYVAPPGLVGNNGTSHVHFQLYRGGRGVRNPLPFAPPAGLPLDGTSLPDGGSSNQYLGTGPLVSTNGAATTAVTAGDGRGVTTGTSSRGTAARPAGTLSAVVRGVGDCLTVRTRPALDAEVAYCLLDGSAVTIVEGPLRADDQSWYRLQGFGWAIGDNLRAVSGKSIP